MQIAWPLHHLPQQRRIEDRSPGALPVLIQPQHPRQRPPTEGKANRSSGNRNKLDMSMRKSKELEKQLKNVKDKSAPRPAESTAVSRERIISAARKAIYERAKKAAARRVAPAALSFTKGNI
jgi:hypothetical protein